MQQLRYVIQVVASGSISSAAARLLIAQPSLSKAVSDLEREMGVTIFERTSKGVTLTEDGERFCAYARQVVDQADLLEGRYKDAGASCRSLAVTAPHDPTVIGALADVARAHADERFVLRLREGGAETAIEDVRTQRSEIGVALRPAPSRERFDAAVRDAGLRYAPVTTFRPQVLVSETSPLAGRESVDGAALEGMPCVQHVEGSDGLGVPGALGSEFAGPGLGELGTADAVGTTSTATRRVRVTDWDTLRRLVIALDGFAVSLSISPAPPVGGGLASVPLAGDALVDAGLLTRPGYPLSAPARAFATTMSEFSRLHRS